MTDALATRVRLPARARRGETIEIRILVQHPMESGQRRGADGQLVPRRILNALSLRFDGEEILSARFEPAMAANPLLGFHLRAERSGMIELVWTEDGGAVHRSTHRLEVVG